MPRRHRLALSLSLSIALALAACAEDRPRRAEPGLASAAPDAEAARPGSGPAAHPLIGLGVQRQGSRLLLAKAAARTLAFVADEDARAVRVVDPASHDELSRLALGGKPAQLAIGGDGRLYASLRDKGQVAALELSGPNSVELTQTVTLETPTEPVGLAVTPDGDTLLVVSAWAGKLSAYALPKRAKAFEVALAREPRGVAVSADGRRAYVSHAMGPNLSRVALDGDRAVAPIAVGGHDFVPSFGGLGFFGVLDASPQSSEIIGILSQGVAPNEIGVPMLAPSRPEGSPAEPDRGADEPLGFRSIARPPRASMEQVPRDAAQGFAVVADDEGVFVPLVLVHRGNVPTGGYGTSDSFPAHQPAIAQLVGGDDIATVRVMNHSFRADTSRTDFAGGARRDGCFLPRAAAIDSRRQLLLVACLGTDEVLAFDTAPGPLSVTARARWKVAPGPMGIAVDEDAGTAMVWSQLGRTVSTLSLPERDPEDDGKLRIRYRKQPADPAKATELSDAGGPSAAARRGRALFHAAGDPRISSDGRACASCHPDGRDDGLTWPSPNGPRQTPMLAGRLGEATRPYGWQGDADTIAEHVKGTFQRLGGRGLGDNDLADLVAYCLEMDVPASAADPDPQLVARGRELFESETVGCATCHTDGGRGSDGARHNVGGGVEVETPALSFVARTAPYFHDGRFATLADMLRETRGKMGWAADMSDDDLRALEAYLQTL